VSRKCLLVIRIRSGIDAKSEVKRTLKMLRVGRTNYATLVDDRPDYMGMLMTVKDRVTWGEVSAATIRELLEKRGETAYNKKIEQDSLKALGYETFDQLAQKLYSCESELPKMTGLKPFFRLHPPRKGFRGKTKLSFGASGEAGYRGERINELASRMI